jgi:ABC-type lipoprotein release transport system permease subunit
MPFELFLALRYLVARRKQAFLSLISVISTIGVATGSPICRATSRGSSRCRA